jgi:hypothetical protein
MFPYELVSKAATRNVAGTLRGGRQSIVCFEGVDAYDYVVAVLMADKYTCTMHATVVISVLFFLFNACQAD